MISFVAAAIAALKDEDDGRELPGRSGGVAEASTTVRMLLRYGTGGGGRGSRCVRPVAVGNLVGVNGTGDQTKQKQKVAPQELFDRNEPERYKQQHAGGALTRFVECVEN